MVSAQEGIDPNGYNILYYPNGKILSEGYMKNGKPEGYWKTYYTTGILKAEGNRKNYLLDSVWIFYNSTGDTISKINYLLGRKNGYYTEYNTDRSRPEYIGAPKSKELYVNDLKEGRSFYYYPDGKIREVVDYENDKPEGTGIEYAEDGRIITIKRYNKGSLVERQKINRYDSERRKDGEWLEFYEGIKVRKEMNYKNGLLNGYYKEYNPLGKLTMTLLYEDGKLVQQVEEKNEEISIRESKDENGNLISGPFIEDKPVGIHKTYDIKGDVIATKVYDDFGVLLSEGIIDREGKKEGTWTEYYPSGKTRASGEYKNNNREGKWTFFFEDGKVEQEGSYRNGKEHGEWRRYYDNGQLFVEESYYSGKEDGMYIEYDENNNMITEGEYLEGEREGDWVEEINDFKAEGKYITGLRDGKWKYYYDDGTLMFEGNYIQGNPDGKHKYYYPDGSLKEEQYYSSGLPDKHWKKYDENGELIVTISYDNGKEYRINGVKIDLPDDNTVILK